ncbi:hypothetical protein GT204_00640 [Streptomyces sp. SID4919]|uniref:DUF6571 family protein n=1 Tax=unclassified Streptomyces TaxID=2593676 RepID=UPI000823A386|nr:MULTISPECIES: DUF6571 family protein [unclassified Streptomyces]MYY07434.1 hypothetical protein [Streptomyces sp. SID4919]SCK62113.1 hypothetical protein YW7DRAFT_06502 [Streptomyces sp. AmelKG-E11A]
MDFAALQHADLGPLGTAVSDWSTLIGNLETLAKAARDGLKGQADKAVWVGVNAAVSKTFIAKTASEFDDARTQASSIRNILRDTRADLLLQRRNLEEAIGRGAAKNLTVTATGDGEFTVTMRVHPDRAGKGSSVPDHDEADLVALRDEVQKILVAATEIDAGASKVLRALVDQSELGFSEGAYNDRDTAVKAVREAEALAGLARQKPQDLSVAEFDRLVAGLKRYADDPLFSARFAGELGAKGTLEFWSGVNDPGLAGYQLTQERRDRFDDLQKHLGLTLAHATQSDSQAMNDWKREMTALGGKPVGPHGSHVGFQVMSSLMRWGDYNDRFLTRYGRALVKAEKEYSENGTRSPIAWHRSAADPQLNHTGTDTGADPFTGFLKALANSPDASTTFFGDPFLARDESDHAKGGMTNFEYLFEERDWPPDTDSKGETSIAGRNILAQALESAVTGHPAGEMPTADTPAHSYEQATLMEQIVHSVSEKPERLLDHRYMADSLGQISTEYMPDISRGLNPQMDGEGRLMPVAGSMAEPGAQDLTRFLYTLGRTPDGYAAVNVGQHSYTASLMEYHFRNPDAYIADPQFKEVENLKEGVGSIAQVAGEIQGTISAGRAYEGEVEGGAKDREYNDALNQGKVWVGSAVGIGIGLGTAAFIGPGGIVAGGFAGTTANEILGSLTEGSMKDSANEVIYRNGEQLSGTQESTYRLLEQAAVKAGEQSGNPSQHIESIVARSAQNGFTAAHSNVGLYVNGQGVPKALEKD